MSDYRDAAIGSVGFSSEPLRVVIFNVLEGFEVIGIAGEFTDFVFS